MDKIRLENPIGHCVGYLVVINGDEVYFFESDGQANEFISQKRRGKGNVAESKARVTSRHGQHQNFEVWKTEGRSDGDFHIVSGPERDFKSGTYDEADAIDVATTLSERFDSPAEDYDEAASRPGGI